MLSDFHMHLLPQVDHGSQSVEESIQMLQDASNYGINTVAATPHYYPENADIEKFLVKRENAYIKLTEALPDVLKGMKIIKGAEVMLSPQLSEKEIEKLSFDESRYILIEMPYAYWTDWVYNKIFNMISCQNRIPIIAHVERFIPYQLKSENIQKLLQMEVIPQINAGSFCRLYHNRSFRKLMNGLDQFLIGSDRHSAKDIYNLPAAMKKLSKLYGEETRTNLEINSEDVVKNIVNLEII